VNFFCSASNSRFDRHYRYITRSDGSPLMTALSTWREATLQDKDTRSLSRSLSPSSRSDTTDGELGPKPAIVKDTRTRASSTSWVRWWSRGRRATPVETPSSGQITRSELKGTPSEPLRVNVVRLFWFHFRFMLNL
jgi:phosphatidate phosphatase LPIN